MRVSVVRAVGVAVLCLSLSACQPGDRTSGPPHVAEASPSPTVPPSPSVDPAEAAIAERAAAAEQRYREYLKIRERHHTSRTGAFQELFDNGYLGNPEMRDAEEADDDLFAAENLTQTGEVRIASIEATGYDGDPLAGDILGHRVTFAVCLDYTGYDLVRRDGTSAIAEDQRDRVFMNVVMQGQGGDIWSLDTNKAEDREC